MPGECQRAEPHDDERVGRRDPARPAECLGGTREGRRVRGLTPALQVAVAEVRERLLVARRAGNGTLQRRNVGRTRASRLHARRRCQVRERAGRHRGCSARTPAAPLRDRPTDRGGAEQDDDESGKEGDFPVSRHPVSHPLGRGRDTAPPHALSTSVGPSCSRSRSRDRRCTREGVHPLRVVAVDAVSASQLRSLEEPAHRVLGDVDDVVVEPAAVRPSGGVPAEDSHPVGLR